LEDIQKLIKVDVKTVSDHPYPWHAGSPTASGTAKPKNSNRSGGAHRKSDASKQNKKTLVLIIVDYNTKSKASYKK
jgi:ATP-dependent RNA helicase RhlE